MAGKRGAKGAGSRPAKTPSRGRKKAKRAGRGKLSSQVSTVKARKPAETWIYYGESQGGPVFRSSVPVEMVAQPMSQPPGFRAHLVSPVRRFFTSIWSRLKTFAGISPKAESR